MAQQLVTPVPGQAQPAAATTAPAPSESAPGAMPVPAAPTAPTAPSAPAVDASPSKSYHVELNFSGSDVSLKEIDLTDTPAPERVIQPLVGWRCEVLASGNVVENSFLFDIPVTTCSDVPGKDAGLTGGCVSKDKSSFSIEVPYYENGIGIAIFRPDGKSYYINTIGFAKLCGDNICESNENYATCPQDCRSGVKDGYCDGVADGTCEFLVGVDGTISFLEVNTRLQVEHPVSEEVTGFDLVREQFRIAMGEELGYDDPEIRGHSIEFRINGEDPGRSFLPAPGRITQWNLPSGPGVRVDAGFKNGDTIGGNFDSLLAKLIVTGKTREEAISRARRALEEFQIGGLATALPFHRAILEDPAYTENFTVYTSYIENEFNNEIPNYGTTKTELQSLAASEHLVAEVNGHRFDIRLHAPEPLHKRHRAKAGMSGLVAGDGLTSPMQGTVVKIALAEGDFVEVGDLVIVLEAMKMEQALLAHKSGVIANLTAVIGESVTNGAKLCDIIDA